MLTWALASPGGVRLMAAMVVVMTIVEASSRGGIATDQMYVRRDMNTVPSLAFASAGDIDLLSSTTSCCRRKVGPGRW